MGERQNYTKSFIITSNTKSGSLPPLLVSIQRRVVTQLWGVIIRLGPDTGRRGECTLTHISCCCLISKQTHSSPHMCLSYWQPSLPSLTPTPFNRRRHYYQGSTQQGIHYREGLLDNVTLTLALSSCNTVSHVTQQHVDITLATLLRITAPIDSYQLSQSTDLSNIRDTGQRRATRDYPLISSQYLIQTSERARRQS